MPECELASGMPAHASEAPTTTRRIASDTDATPNPPSRVDGAHTAFGCLSETEHARIQPLSGSTFRVVFTARESLKQKLDRARELCSHRVSPTDLPALLERALDLLIEQEEKRRYAVHPPKGSTKVPSVRIRNGRIARSPTPHSQQDLGPAASVEPALMVAAPTESRRSRIRATSTRRLEQLAVKEFSRHVPASVRRAVWERDGAQCAFIADDGKRCTERRYLEIDHVVPHARGGPTTVGNCRLTCKAHNQHQAKRTFGVEFIDRARALKRSE